MKKLRLILLSISLLLIIIVLHISLSSDIHFQDIFTENVITPDITWSVESDGLKYKVIGEFNIDNITNTDNILMLRSHWKEYYIKADGKLAYDSASGDGGAIRLIDIPPCSVVSIEFAGVEKSSTELVKQASFYVGDRIGMHVFLIKRNMHIFIFTVAVALLGVISIIVGIYMRSLWKKNVSSTLISLGVYILIAGLWVVTDSELLLLFTQRTGLVELVSFSAFYSLPVALIEFTKRMITGKDKMFGILQNIFIGVFILYAVNYIPGLFPVIVVIMAEHTVMAVSIVLILKCCIESIKKHSDSKLLRVMHGYIAFSICSIIAFIFYYKGDARRYLFTYMMGLLIFVFCLAYAACIALYEQIKENANVEVYTRMAYKDMMTGLGNRAAFLEEQKSMRNYAGAAAYIMIDANNLKKINDNYGHQKGDILRTEIAKCIRTGVNGRGRSYRIGGDEFVVSLINVTEAEVSMCATAIRSEIEKDDSQSDIDISAAIAYAWTDDKDKDVDALLEQADAAMYENKQYMKQAMTNV